jgi:hypothetical protein
MISNKYNNKDVHRVVLLNKISAAFQTVFLAADQEPFHNIVLKPGIQILAHSVAGSVGGVLVQLVK